MRTLLNSYTLDIPRKLPIIGVEPLFRRDEKRPAPGTPMWHQRPHSTWGCCWRLARRAEREERLPESHRLRARYPGTGGPHRGQLRLALGGGLLHRSPAGHQLQEQLGAGGSGPAPGRGRSHPGSQATAAAPALHRCTRCTSRGRTADGARTRSSSPSTTATVSPHPGDDLRLRGWPHRSRAFGAISQSGGARRSFTHCDSYRLPCCC